jgi:hypothetical protein
MASVLTAKLTRHRSLPNAGSRTLFFKLEVGRLGRFLDPHQVPDFDGDEAWFEYQKVRGEITLLRQIDNPRRGPV